MSKEKQNIITLSSDDGDIDVEVIDQTVVDGTTYLLVADVLAEDEEEGDCYILKDVSGRDSDYEDYEVVDDEEADRVFEIFSDMIEDIRLKK